MDEVGVNERISRVERWLLRLGGLERIEHRVDGCISGGVGDHLPAVPVADRNSRANLLRRQREEPAVRGIVDGIQVVSAGAKWIAHERRADQDATIDENLERPDLQPVVPAARTERQAADELLHSGRGCGMRIVTVVRTFNRPARCSASYARYPSMAASRSITLVIPVAMYC